VVFESPPRKVEITRVKNYPTTAGSREVFTVVARSKDPRRSGGLLALDAIASLRATGFEGPLPAGRIWPGTASTSPEPSPCWAKATRSRPGAHRR